MQEKNACNLDIFSDVFLFLTLGAFLLRKSYFCMYGWIKCVKIVVSCKYVSVVHISVERH